MKLEAKNITCGYRGKSVLEQVNFTVESGEICCLLGPNGVGKTTLFRSVLGLMPLIDGKVVIDGEDTKPWSSAKRAKAMAYVAQYHTPPFPYLVKDVVLLGRISSVGYFGQPKPYDYELVTATLAEMGIEHLADTAYTDISGGERQLVMIARALVQQAGILVLDEPTASLDYGNMVRVIRKIIALRDKGYGIIMTTHSPDQAFMCDSKVVLLQKERPVLFGTVSGVMTEQNLKEVYGVRIRVMEYAGDDGQIRHMCVPEY